MQKPLRLCVKLLSSEQNPEVCDPELRLRLVGAGATKAANSTKAGKIFFTFPVFYRCKSRNLKCCTNKHSCILPQKHSTVGLFL